MLPLTILVSVLSNSIKRNMENSEYETVLNYVARGEYPAGTTKEQKRAIRRRTMHVCKGGPNFRSGGQIS